MGSEDRESLQEEFRQHWHVEAPLEMRQILEEVLDPEVGRLCQKRPRCNEGIRVPQFYSRPRDKKRSAAAPFQRRPYFVRVIGPVSHRAAVVVSDPCAALLTSPRRFLVRGLARRQCACGRAGGWAMGTRRYGFPQVARQQPVQWSPAAASVPAVPTASWTTSSHHWALDALKSFIIGVMSANLW